MWPIPENGSLIFDEDFSQENAAISNALVKRADKLFSLGRFVEAIFDYRRAEQYGTTDGSAREHEKASQQHVERFLHNQTLVSVELRPATPCLFIAVDGRVVDLLEGDDESTVALTQNLAKALATDDSHLEALAVHGLIDEICKSVSVFSYDGQRVHLMSSFNIANPVIVPST